MEDYIEDTSWINRNGYLIERTESELVGDMALVEEIPFPRKKLLLAEMMLSRCLNGGRSNFATILKPDKRYSFKIQDKDCHEYTAGVRLDTFYKDFITFKGRLDQFAPQIFLILKSGKNLQQWILCGCISRALVLKYYKWIPTGNGYVWGVRLEHVSPPEKLFDFMGMGVFDG